MAFTPVHTDASVSSFQNASFLPQLLFYCNSENCLWQRISTLYIMTNFGPIEITPNSQWIWKEMRSSTAKVFESILRVYFVNLFRFSVLSFQFALLNWHSCVFEILLKSWILQFLCAYVCKDSLHNYFGILVKMKWQQFLIVTSSLENRSYWLYESTISNGSCANRKLSFFWEISKI